MDFLEVKHALQQPDRDTLIEQSLTLIEQSVKIAQYYNEEAFC